MIFKERYEDYFDWLDFLAYSIVFFVCFLAHSLFINSPATFCWEYSDYFLFKALVPYSKVVFLSHKHWQQSLILANTEKCYTPVAIQPSQNCAGGQNLLV